MKAEDINLSDSFELVKEWQGLERAHRDAEFARIMFARKVRQRFAPGANGDRNFKDWCVVNLKIDERTTEIMMSMAIAGGVFKDANEWKAAGGERAITVIATAEPAEQESILRTAKSQGLTASTVWSRRHANKATTRRTPAWDAQRMAEFIAKNMRNVPKPMREIVARYVRLEEKARA